MAKKSKRKMGADESYVRKMLKRVGDMTLYRLDIFNSSLCCVMRQYHVDQSDYGFSATIRIYDHLPVRDGKTDMVVYEVEKYGVITPDEIFTAGYRADVSLHHDVMMEVDGEYRSVNVVEDFIFANDAVKLKEGE